MNKSFEKKKIGDLVFCISHRFPYILFGKVSDIFDDTFFVRFFKTKIVNFWKRSGKNVSLNVKYVLIK
ncbi:hypothetical protein ACFL1Y_00820 [Patescibacteria group bacterium]